MPQNDEYVRLGWQIDEPGVAQVKTSADSIIKKLESIGGEATKTSEAFKRITAVSAELTRASNIQSIAKDFAQLGKTIGNDTDALILLRKSMTEVGASADEISQATRAFKELGEAQNAALGGGSKFGAEGLRRTGGALSQLGAGDAGAAVSRLGDIAQVAKEFQAIGDAMQSLPGILGEAAQAGVAFGGSLGGLLAVVGPAAIAVGAVALAVKGFNDSLAPTSKLLTQASGQLTAYFEAIKTGTSESLKGELAKLDAEKKLIDEEIKVRQAAFDKAQPQTGESGFQQLVKVLAGTRPEVQAVNKELDDLKKKSADADAKIQAFNLALGSTAIAANDAVKAQTDATLKIIDQQTRAAELIRSSTSKQIKDRLDAIQDEGAIIQANLPALEKNKDANTEAKKAYEDATAKLKDLATEQKYLNDIVAPAVKLREDEKKAIEDFLSVQKEGVEWRKKQNKAEEDEAARIVKDTEDRNNRVADVQKKYNDDIAKADEQDAIARANIEKKLTDTLENIDEKSAEQRADLQKKYNDQLVDLARKAADDAAKALVDLQRKRDDLATDFARGEEDAQRDAQIKQLDLQIKFQEAQEKAFRDHQRNLEKIRQDAQDREFELVLNRDFAGLFASRRQTTRDLRNENTRFGDEQSDAAKARQKEQSDLARSLEQERQARLRHYQQAQQDLTRDFERQRQDARTQHAIALREAKIAYDRELAQQDVAKKRQLDAAKHSYDQEMAALNAHTRDVKRQLENRFKDEIAIAALYGKAYNKKQEEIQDALIAQAERKLREITRNERPDRYEPPAPRASGGPLNAGQWATVNERESSGHESYTSGGRTVKLPGTGLFMPFQAGTVNANNNSKTITLAPTFNITGGANPQMTAEAIRPVVISVLKDVAGVN